ncbi:YdcF family protein [Enterococcus sp. LJL99]
MNIYLNVLMAIIYIVGLFSIPKWREKKGQKDWKFYDLAWTFLNFVAYLLLLELQIGTYYFLIPLAFFGLFFFVYRREKRRLINGLFFNLFLISGGVYLTFLVFRVQNWLLIGILGALAVLLILLLLFGLYALIIFLYWNGFTILRKEGHSFANLLTLLLAIALTIFLIISTFYARFLPDWAGTLFLFIPMMLLYFFVVFYNFLTISVIYQFNKPKYEQDFIIVLGSGLIDGKIVPPLLGKRIDKAIQFYKAQSRATLHPLKLVMSGGKGDDEHLAESVAMKNYALEKGIPDEDILVEANSKNTLENMLFSKEIIENSSDNKNYKVIFTTNNFHLFRSGIFARKAGLKADGIGAKTAFYFLPNAFLREFIAIIVMYKKRHLVVAGLVAMMLIALALIQLLVIQ